MARRNKPNLIGKRYLGNTNTREVHDLDNEQIQCKVDTIIAHNHADGFATYEEAKRAGYDNCAYCIGNSLR